MAHIEIAAEAPHHRVPHAAFLLIIPVLAYLLCDAIRHPGEPWFRWLAPVASVFLWVSVLLFSVPLVILAAFAMAAGIGLSNYWRWTHGRNR